MVPIAEEAPTRARVNTRFFRPELNALRFFAFACVFCDHLPYTPGGWFAPIANVGSFGLCMFFMLSAYLIVTLLLKERDEFGDINLLFFAIRRAIRIWPLYFFALTLGSIIGLFWPPAHLTLHGFAAMMVFLTNIYILKKGWLLGIIAPLWSISLEEQFYILIPALAQLSRRRVMTNVFLLVILLAYVALALEGHQHAVYLVGAWANSFVQFQFFAAGGLFALWNEQQSVTLRLPARLFLFTAGIGCWFVAAVRYSLHSWSAVPAAHSLMLGYAFLLLGTALIFVAFLETSVKIPKWLNYLGKISYGLYVYHMFCVQMFLGGMMQYTTEHRRIGALFAFTATAGVAALSYKFFERPILRYKQRFERVKTVQA